MKLRILLWWISVIVAGSLLNTFMFHIKGWMSWLYAFQIGFDAVITTGFVALAMKKKMLKTKSPVE